MAKAELGTKRTCPETDKKFYDLGKDPVVSPYTGKSYPLSFFDLPTGPSRAKAAPPIQAVKPEPAEDEDDDLELDDEAEIVSLDDADEDTSDSETKNMPDLGDNTDDDIEDVELDDDDDDDDVTFLAADDDDDDDDDVSDIIVVSGDDDEH